MDETYPFHFGHVTQDDVVAGADTSMILGCDYNLIAPPTRHTLIWRHTHIRIDHPDLH